VGNGKKIKANIRSNDKVDTSSLPRREEKRNGTENLGLGKNTLYLETRLSPRQKRGGEEGSNLSNCKVTLNVWEGRHRGKIGTGKEAAISLTLDETRKHDYALCGQRQEHGDFLHLHFEADVKVTL